MDTKQQISPDPHKDALPWKRTRFNVQTDKKKLIFAVKDLKRKNEDGSTAMNPPTRFAPKPVEKKYVRKGTVLCVKTHEARKAVGTGKWGYVYGPEFEQKASQKPSQVFSKPIETNTRYEETNLAKEAALLKGGLQEEDKKSNKEEKRPRK